MAGEVSVWRGLGRQARRRARRSQWLKPYAEIEGRDAIRLYLPSEPQAAVQIVRPMSLERAEWIRGWDEEKHDDPPIG
jgi:hypothetical protein